MAKITKDNEWAYIHFKFETEKDAYRLYRFIDFGKEMGIVPSTIEIMLNGKVLSLGHYSK